MTTTLMITIEDIQQGLVEYGVDSAATESMVFTSIHGRAVYIIPSDYTDLYSYEAYRMYTLGQVRDGPSSISIAYNLRLHDVAELPGILQNIKDHVDLTID